MEFLWLPLATLVVSLLYAAWSDRHPWWRRWLPVPLLTILGFFVAVGLLESWFFYNRFDAECRIVDAAPGRIWHYAVIGGALGALPWAADRMQLIFQRHRDD